MLLAGRRHTSREGGETRAPRRTRLVERLARVQDHRASAIDELLPGSWGGAGGWRRRPPVTTAPNGRLPFYEHRVLELAREATFPRFTAVRSLGGFLVARLVIGRLGRARRRCSNLEREPNAGSQAGNDTAPETRRYQ